MYFSLASAVVAATLTTTAYAHGIITTPVPRAPGAASLAACGKAVIGLIKADNTSHVEGLPEAALTDSTYNAKACNLWLCKGLQYEGDRSLVQKYKPGQKVPVHVYLRIPHAGTANVSIVETSTNTILGEQLLYWDNYANQSLPAIPANNSDFSVTIPGNIGRGKCASPGDCVSFPSSSLTIMEKLFADSFIGRLFSGGGTALGRSRRMNLA